MVTFFDNFIAAFWDRTSARRSATSGLDLGQVSDGSTSGRQVILAQALRTRHLAVLGKTGSGKSYLLRHIAVQDIQADRGFVFFDLHGDVTPFLLRVISHEENKGRGDLSQKLILIEPADPLFSVGMNVLEGQQDNTSFVQIAEFAQVLKARWGLDTFGARTEELLRNSLYVLAQNRLTLLELGLLLTDNVFRALCLSSNSNSEVTSYFESRYDAASTAMQGVLRDALLNKVSAFTSDPRFRHILGQQHSTFSLIRAIDEGCWIVLDLDKGKLGEQAATLGSLFLICLKNALFARRTRHLFTLYCDEIQNLATFDNGLDVLLSEARKFGVSVVSANQYLDQYPQSMRSAILSVGTHLFFQLSSSDADRIAHALDGGKNLARILKNLPPRHAILKSGYERWREVQVPDVRDSQTKTDELVRRCRERWTKSRALIEEEIEGRRAAFGHSSNEVLHDWE